MAAHILVWLRVNSVKEGFTKYWDSRLTLNPNWQRPVIAAISSPI